MRKWLYFIVVICVTSAVAQNKPLVCLHLATDHPLIRPQIDDLSERAARAIQDNEHTDAVALIAPTSEVHRAAVDHGCSHLIDMKLNMERASVVVAFPGKQDPLAPDYDPRRSYTEHTLRLTFVASPVDDSSRKIEGDVRQELDVEAVGPGVTLQDRLRSTTRNSARDAVRRMKKKWKF